MSEPATGAFLALAAPFAAAVIAPGLKRALGHNAAWILALFPATAFLYFAGLINEVSHHGPMKASVEWIPTLGINLSVYLDGLSLLFALLVTGIGTFIVLYAGGYLKGHGDQGRFLTFIFLFMGAMLGLVIIDDLIALFVFWELTSITSFLLIGFNHRLEKSRRAAIQALVVTGGGGLILLAGFILIMTVTDKTSLSALLEGGSLADHPFYVAIFFLILGGAFTKSAQWPLHFWLPNAMEAPTPVSAYLHSATMVKAGVYLLMRMHPVLGETMLWTTILPLFGLITFVLGTLLALRQKDLKLILAYTTVASLGLLVMLVGTSIEKAIYGAVGYLFAHSLFKGALFMVAGTVDHEAGTRDITKLGGLRSAMPITFGAAIVAAWSMGGLPFSIGFSGKEVLYAGLIGGGGEAFFLAAVSVIANAMMLAAGFAVALYPFIGKTVETPKHAHEGPWLMLLGPVVLAALGFISVLFIGFVEHDVLNPMAAAIMGKETKLHLPVIPPKIDTAVIFSVITMALGFAIWRVVANVRNAGLGFADWLIYGPDRGFDIVIRSIVRASWSISKFAQPGRLEVYTTVTFMLFVTVLFGGMYWFNELPSFPGFEALAIHEIGVLLLAVAGLYAVVRANNRLTAIVSLGIQGFAVALIFMIFGAPDLSFTQFMVETLSVVILALVMTRLNLVPSDHRPRHAVIGDGAIAVLSGIALTLLLFGIINHPFDPTLSEFFTQHSREIAHGRNIVNVIIVDYRGIDTLGEIAVVTIAALAILSLIRIAIKDKTAK